MKRTVLGVLLLAFCAVAQQTATAIVGARVVDGTGAPARMATVIIRGGRIEAVAENGDVPSGSRVIDAHGETLLPGLFDLHTHLTASAVTGISGDWGKNLKAYLACGITTVNDYAEYGEMLAPMRKLIADGLVRAPRINMAARISTTGGHGTESGWGDFMTLTANTPEQAHARMKEILPYRPDVIKVFTDGWRYGTAPDLTSMNEETLAAIVQDAHAAGIRVFTHTVTLRGAKIAARAGVDVLVHGIGDAPVDDELIGLMKANGTFYVSTLAVYEFHSPAKVTPRILSVLEPAAQAIVTRNAASRGDAQPSAEHEKRWGFLMANVKRLSDAGIPVGVGTDAGMPGTYHGFATFREIENLVEAGFTPLRAIAAATTVSARALGVEKDRGAIVAGEAADLVLIDGRPDERIADIEKTSKVWLGGVELDPQKLEAEIHSPEQTVLPVHPAAALVDDMERHDGRTELGTLRVNATDAGIDHSAMLFLPIVRSGGDHALMISAEMGPKPRPFVRLDLPLTPGGVDVADVSGFTGVSFDARGEGTFRLIAQTYGVRQPDPFAAAFTAGGEWQTVKIPFAQLARQAAAAPAWSGKDLRALLFEVAGPAGSGAWLELDNVRFY